MAERILVVDDEETFREVLCGFLQEEGYDASSAPDGPTALEIIRNQDVSVVISDIRMPGGMDGIEVLEQISQISPQTSVIMVTAYGTLDTAVEALRKGAYDYILKPPVFENIILKIKNLLEKKHLALENQSLRRELQKRYDFHNLVGKSELMQKIYRLIEKIAPTDSNVLITGESGTGKELLAKAIHYNSLQKDGKFVPINCSAIPEDLLESELFGHVKGAFTSAIQDKDGLFKIAQGGTLFLDEITELSFSIQAKLLRAIQEKEIRPVGGTSSIKVNLRLIAATNTDIAKLVKEGSFREDLFYRLNVIEINIPPLRERKDDIPLLVKHFIEKYSKQLNKKVTGTDNAAMRALLNYDWEGNIRELENVIERAIVLGEGELITLQDLPHNLNGTNEALKSPGSLKEAMKVYERQHIIRILEETENDKKQTADILQIGLSSLYRKIEELEIPVNGGGNSAQA